ncbi:hypothetical protein PGIGA_G00260740 [Pangasianodon gigas]|uniref:Uncharacterized protein n=1 Tax=Pangasianodon gigas TaxID=30993 RepID=A0ACC5WTU2_PANGG|nr:hypothetical protein [Pangasianodon gigas]
MRKLQLIDSYKVVLIFDGLDECRLPLNFQNNERLCDVTESASVDVLLTNLIKGNLLLSALLWITSRPGAANQIPPECVDQVTENELKRFRKLLSPDYPACTEREVEDEEELHSVREGALKITLHVLKNMNHTDLANTLHNKSVASVYQPKLKSNLREKCKRINEGISQHGSSALLNEIYTELYITEGWSGDVNNEHEVRQIETASRRPATQETPIKSAQLVREISVSLVRRAQRIMDGLDDCDIQCQDLMRDNVAIQFPEIKAKLKNFEDLCSEYKVVFQKHLCRLLPSIRGGGKEEQELSDFLNRKEMSPFQGVLINKYLNEREWEITVVGSYLDIMKDIPVLLTSNDLDKIVLKASSDYVVAFALSSLNEKELYLSDLKNYLKQQTSDKGEQPSYDQSSTERAKEWFSLEDVTAQNRENIQAFVDFKEANKGRTNIEFCIVSIPDELSTASSIRVYERAKLISSEYELPSKPPMPNFLCAAHDCIHLQITPPDHGASLARLSANQRYIFDSILSIFGKDIGENIMIMVTFADSEEIPVPEAIKAADLPCQKNTKGEPMHFKFNNTAVYADKTIKEPTTSDSDSDEDGEANEPTTSDSDSDEDGEANGNKLYNIVWTSTFKQMKAFFKALGKSENKDLTLTKKVLEERERLEKAMADLTPQITAGLTKLREINTVKERLKNERNSIKQSEDFEQEVEECCEDFRQKLRQALGGQVVLPDHWETTAEVIRVTGRKVLGVSSGRRKEDKETWWWNEEVQDSIQSKRLAKKKWDMDRTEESRQEYKELQRRVKREVSKAKQEAYDELYTRLDTREEQTDLYRLARQRDRDGKDVQQGRVIKDRDGRVLTSEESVQRRWKEYSEELMNEENEREKRVEGVTSVEKKVDKIRKDEVRKALKRMKSGKAVGPDDIPVEVWKCLGEAAVEFLTSLFNRVLESEKIPEEWGSSVLVPIFKNKGDVQSCSNYRGIKLMSHTMKLWERVVEARLRKVVEICEQQYGFMPRKSTTDAIFALRILMETYRDGQRELHCVFVDLEKAYDRVPREELWYCMRKSGVAEKYVRVVQDIYERSRTVVRCAVGQTEEFKVEVGLHQGSALSPFLFAMVMDQLSEEVRQESPRTMMFADDIVICSESREQVEENLERWRFALERRGMKVSRSKTEYVCVNEREGSGTVRLQGEEVKKVQEFKYLGSTVQSIGECGKEVKKRVQAGWNGWRKVSGVLCDRKISARIKGKVYKTVVRPAMLYGLETVALRTRQE